jgi:hypothetical protein
MDVTLPPPQSKGKSTASPRTSDPAAVKPGDGEFKPHDESASPPPNAPPAAVKPEAGPPPGASIVLNFPPDYKSFHKEAAIARDFAIPAALSLIIGAERVSTLGAASYLTTIYPDGKTPADPVEKILLEQLVMAHHRSALLNVRAHQAVNPESVAIFSTAATRLGAEIRRTALAIRQYRQPSSSKSFSVIHQQNVTAGSGDQQVSYVDQSANGEEKVSFSCRQSELGGKENDNTIGGRFGVQSEESKPGGCRQDQRREEATVER